MSNTLSVVRYRYNAAQVLAEILRQELNESDDERNDSFSVDNDSSECEDVVEVNDDVPDELDEAGVDISYCDSDDTVDYDVAAFAAAVADGDGDVDGDVVNGDVAAATASTGDDDGDRDDVMWSRCGSIAWKRRCPHSARQPRRNVLMEQAGLPDGLQFDTILDTFKLFIDAKMVDHILACSNRHADEIKAKSPNFRWNKPLSSDEFYAFIGLNLVAGVQKSRNQQLMELWDEQWGYPVFRTTMSFHRFADILRVLRLDDKTTRDQRILETGNQGAAVQEVLEQFVVNCRSSYRCGPSVTVDEQLINFYGNCRFRMFIPSKPGKYGLKL